MSNIKWFLLLLLLLAINNIFLISYFDLTDRSTADTPRSGEEIRQVTETLRQESGRQDGSDEVLESRQVEQAQNQDLVTQLSSDQTFEESFVALSQSTVFQKIMDRYYLQSAERSMRRMERLNRMSGSELYELFVSSDDVSEKLFAMQGLSQGKISELESFQIKELWHASEVEVWGKMQALKVLLERDDTQAVEWAKAALEDSGLMMFGGHEVLPLLYEKDPEFVRAFVDSLTVNSPTHNLTFLFQEPELQRVFFQNNLDDILESSNTSIFQMVPYNVNLEMSRTQKSKVVSLLADSSRVKRHFALGLMSNIKDEQLLREAYANLTRDQEKQMLLSAMMSGGNVEANRQLIAELARDSNNPQLRVFSERLSQ